MLINTHTPTRAITHFTVSPKRQPTVYIISGSRCRVPFHPLNAPRVCQFSFDRGAHPVYASASEACAGCVTYVCICAYRWLAAAHEWREKRAAQLSADLRAECWVALVVVGALLVFRVTRSIVFQPDRTIYTIHERTFCSTDM